MMGLAMLAPLPELEEMIRAWRRDRNPQESLDCAPPACFLCKYRAEFGARRARLMTLMRAADGATEILHPSPSGQAIVGCVSRYEAGRRERRKQESRMRLLLAAALALLLTAEAQASCVCRCVDGEMQPLCGSSIDLPPICPLTACALAPPSVKPMQPLGILPPGTSQCSQHQVLNPATRQYEWRSVCN
jgi:hypothetical protein